MTVPFEPSAVVAAILAGRLDDHIDDLVEALGQRVADAKKERPWRIEVGATVVTEEDLTWGEAAAIQRILKIEAWWRDIDLMDPLHQLAVCSVRLARLEGISQKEAIERLEHHFTAREALEGVSRYTAIPLTDGTSSISPPT